MSLSRFAYLSTVHPRTRRQERANESYGDIVVLNKFGVIPYRSYLQPYGPIFAPRGVKMQIWYGEVDALDASQGCLYYESEEYAVKHVEGEQVFALPKPVTLLTSNRNGSPVFTVRVVLLGAHQRQTFGEHTGIRHHNWYYICISQITLYGASLQRTMAILRDHVVIPNQPKHATFFANCDGAKRQVSHHLHHLDPLSRATITTSAPINITNGHRDSPARIQWRVDI